MPYVTVDLDKPSILEILRAWDAVKLHDPDHDITGRVSKSGTGVHIRSRRVLDGNPPLAKFERLDSGDDPHRVAGDERDDLSYNQVLWDRQGEDRAGEWHETLDSLIRDFIDSRHKDCGDSYVRLTVKVESSDVSHWRGP